MIIIIIIFLMFDHIKPGEEANFAAIKPHFRGKWQENCNRNKRNKYKNCAAKSRNIYGIQAYWNMCGM